MQNVSDKTDRVAIKDPRVPPAVREHAQRLRQPVCYVVTLEHNEFVLLDAQGKVVDLIWIK